MKALSFRSMIIGLFFFLLAAAAFAKTGPRYALVIGNGAYKTVAALPNTVNDALSVAAALEQLGFTTDLRLNLTEEQFSDAIDRHLAHLSSDRDSEGFIWYAGHGVQINGENYFLPVDVSVKSERNVEQSAFSLSRILEDLETAGNKVNVVVLDACRDNPLPKTATRSAARGLAVVQDVPGDQLVIFSTAPGDKALDGDGKNSPFTTAFLKYINSGDPVVLMASDAARETMALTGGRQRPFTRGSLISDGRYSLNPGGVTSGIPPAYSLPPAAAPPQNARMINPDAPDIMAKFGITDRDASAVEAAFTAVHNYIQGKTRAQIIEGIRPGDYIELAGLTVQGDGSGKNAAESGAVTLTAAGKTKAPLRLIAAGVCSFNGKNGNDTPHVVFQFENIPALHRMNPANTNAGGYAKSELRRYLLNNFLPGLIAAGLPEAYLWAPSRRAANGGAKDASAADTIADKLWLPTIWEIRGKTVKSRYETDANQVRLEYYPGTSGAAQNIKYKDDASAGWYWTASPSVSSTANFMINTSGGDSHGGAASAVGGVVPAFCIK